MERLDFSDFEAKVRAREGLPGMAQTSPRLLVGAVAVRHAARASAARGTGSGFARS